MISSVINYEATIQHISEDEKQCIETMVSKFMEYNSPESPGWKQYMETKQFRAFSKTIDDITCVRAVMTYPYSIMDIVKVLCLRRKVVEEPLEFNTILDVYSPNTTLEYQKYKAVWPTSSRDFLTITHWRMLEGGKFLIFSYSKENEELCPTMASSVRGDMKIGGYLMEPLGDWSTQVSYLLHVSV
jgi:hypothetical protein